MGAEHGGREEEVAAIYGMEKSLAQYLKHLMDQAKILEQNLFVEEEKSTKLRERICQAEGMVSISEALSFELQVEEFKENLSSAGKEIENAKQTVVEAEKEVLETGMEMLSAMLEVGLKRSGTREEMLQMQSKTGDNDSIEAELTEAITAFSEMKTQVVTSQQDIDDFSDFLDSSERITEVVMALEDAVRVQGKENQALNAKIDFRQNNMNKH